jgi:hypothetical protein
MSTLLEWDGGSISEMVAGMSSYGRGLGAEEVSARFFWSSERLGMMAKGSVMKRSLIFE